MILINGNFLCRNLTGIERFSWEICKRLDNLIQKNDEFAILAPANAKNFPEFKKIKLIISEKSIKSFPKWDLFDFKKACKKHNAIGLSFSNTAPLGKACGYAFIHDIYAHDFPKDFVSLKEKLIKAYCNLNYKNIAKNAKKIFTVSEFSAKQIKNAYKISDSRISVIPNGWEHFNSIQKDDGIFEKYPKLQKKNFYFTLGSLQKRKNLKWIAVHAKNHPQEMFAISGRVISGYESEEISELSSLSNVILLGYVSDEEVKALMSECKAFVFPSYYEGFGIPPLEAMSVGAKIICANAASLPEIYENSAHYIDINQNPADVDFEKLLLEKVEPNEKILEKYTYEKSAKKLLEAIRNG